MADELSFGPFFLLDRAARERLRALATRTTLQQGDVLIEETFERAWRMLRNQCSFRHSSRNRPLKLSM